MTITLEVRALEEAEGCMNWTTLQKAEVFGLYVGKPGSFAHIADYPTYEKALEEGTYFATHWGIPLYDMVYEGKNMHTFIASENPECCRKCGTRTETLESDEHGNSIEKCPHCGYKYKLVQPDEDDDD